MQEVDSVLPDQLENTSDRPDHTGKVPKRRERDSVKRDTILDERRREGAGRGTGKQGGHAIPQQMAEQEQKALFCAPNLIDMVEVQHVDGSRVSVRLHASTPFHTAPRFDPS